MVRGEGAVTNVSKNTLSMRHPGASALLPDNSLQRTLAIKVGPGKESQPGHVVIESCYLTVSLLVQICSHFLTEVNHDGENRDMNVLSSKQY